jgi:hypothetical protein
MIVKAVSEERVRLNIRESTQREWRQEFARHLRQLVRYPLVLRASR